MLTEHGTGGVEGRQHRRILFMAEAVTLAHVARPVVLAQFLDPYRYTIVLACDARYLALFGDLPFEWVSLRTIPSAQFIGALAKGSPVYDTDTLRSYVRQDLALIEAVNPDLVVGDFRISLGVSAEVAGVPYFTVTNAYWSRYCRLPLPLPELPMNKVFGRALAKALFRLFGSLGLAYHCLPLNRVRRDYGLPGLGFDLREIYTHADEILYADIPDLVPTAALPSHHHWLGPVLWSPVVELPPWWPELSDDEPIVYVTLGSSGEGNRLLPIVFDGLAKMPVTVVAATAGQALPASLPINVRVAAFLPGMTAVARARLVICNGGSPTTQQALAAGVPVIGIAANMDQHLNMICLEQAGAGVLLRAGDLTADRLATTAALLLQDEPHRQAARSLMRRIGEHDTAAVFRERVSSQWAD